MIRPEDVHRLVRATGNVHLPVSRLVCIENALGSGRVLPLDHMKAVYQAAKEHGLAVHLDGARIFNAAASLGVPAEEIAQYADSVMFCVSKGLCAPIGSLVCGSADFVQKVRGCRKVLGGGLRQAGVLAACGLIALEKMTLRLSEDHGHARLLGRLLAEISGVSVDLPTIEINMVFWRTTIEGFDDKTFIPFMAEKGIKLSGASAGTYRLVTHHDVSPDDVELFIKHFRSYLASIGGR